MKQMPVESFFFALGRPISAAMRHLGLLQLADREQRARELRLVQPVQEVALVLGWVESLEQFEPDYGKRLLAEIAVKNHDNGSLNPKAHFQNRLTVEQVVRAPIVAWPLGLYDCCGVSDGAAAAIVVRADRAKDFRADTIYIKALAISVGARQGCMRQDYDYVHIEENVIASRTAYDQAGIKDPRKELSVAEVHDCFTCHELILYEDLGFSPRGRARDDIEARTFKLTGELPVNTDGGLKCFGHPLGATGAVLMTKLLDGLRRSRGRYGLQTMCIGHGMATATVIERL